MQIKTALTSTASSAQSEAPDPSVGKMNSPSAAKHDLARRTEGLEQGTGRSPKQLFGDVFDALVGQEATNPSKPQATELSAPPGDEIEHAAPSLAEAEVDHSTETENPERAGEGRAKQVAMQPELEANHQDGSEKPGVSEARTVEGTKSSETNLRNAQDVGQHISAPLSRKSLVQNEVGRRLGAHSLHVESARSEIGSVVSEYGEQVAQRAVEQTQPTAGVSSSNNDEDKASISKPTISIAEDGAPATRFLNEKVGSGGQKIAAQNGQIVRAMPVEGLTALALDPTKFETLGQFSQMPNPSETALAAKTNPTVTPELGTETSFSLARALRADQKTEPFAESVFSLRTQTGNDRSGLVFAAFETQLPVDEASQQKAAGPTLQGTVAETRFLSTDQKISATLPSETSVVALVAQKSVPSQDQGGKFEPISQGPVKVMKTVQFSQGQAIGADLGDKRTVVDGASQTLPKNSEGKKLIPDLPNEQKPVTQTSVSLPSGKVQLTESDGSRVSADKTVGAERRIDLASATQTKITASPQTKGENMMGKAAVADQSKADSASATSQVTRPEINVRVARSEPERSSDVKFSTSPQTEGAKAVSTGEKALAEPFAFGKPAEATKLEVANLPSNSEESGVAEHRVGRILLDSAPQRVGGETPSTVTSQPVAAQPNLGEQVALSLADEGGQNLQISAVEVDADADLFDPVLREVRGDAGVQSAANTHTGIQNGQANNVRQIAAQIHEALAKGSQRPVEITLNPQELGAVRMAMQMSEASIGLTIMIERSETLDLLRRHIDQLVADFKELGYENIDLSLSSGGFSGQGAPEQDDATADTVSSSQDDVDAALPVQQLPPSSAGTATGVDLRV